MAGPYELAPAAPGYSRFMTAEQATRPPTLIGDDGIARCAWASSAAEYLRYHDDEWGSIQRDDTALFEKVCLEGFQAGLSWITILRKRPAFREAFHGFNVAAVAEMSDDEVAELLDNQRIIRNRRKIEATISNARATLGLNESLSDFLWGFAPDSRNRKRPEQYSDVPAFTPESTALSNALRQHGFTFVGPTMVYALMQATGMVDDHFAGCWRAHV
jgi:DNA-3-methyladenine glycosylase I